jgi:hypothetical protein
MARHTKEQDPPRLIPADLGAWKTEVDRARDFIAVFNGESSREQGQRVFMQMEIWCSPAPNAAHAERPGYLAYKEGRRSILKEILDASNINRKRSPEIERTPPNDDA